MSGGAAAVGGEVDPAGSAPAANESCPACGARFHCGAVAGEDHCWCFDLPPVAAAPPPGEGARCLCPDCLAKGIEGPAR